MADVNTTDDQFLVNNPDDTNPIEDMKDDQRLPEDHETPFSPPEGVQDKIDDTFPATDSNVDPNDRYQSGIEAAAGVDMPAEDSDEKPDAPFAA
jgi:hypothetical protein